MKKSIGTEQSLLTLVMATGLGLAVPRRWGLDAAVADVAALIGLPGQAVTVSFRGRRCTVLAQLRPTGLACRPLHCREPITDVMSLELVSGSGQAPDWPRPVDLHALIETGRDALRTVQRASRWASYAARVAVVPAERVTERACLEASLRGVWIITVGEPSRVVVTGESGPVTGARRGVVHRWLDEIVAQALLTGETAAAEELRLEYEPS